MKNSSEHLPSGEASNGDFPVLSDKTDPPLNTNLGAQPEIKGRFTRGKSGNPKGRPKKTFNNATMAARAILEESSTRLMAKAVELAMGGSIGPLKLCLERIVPRDRPVQMPMAAPQSAPTEKPASKEKNAPTEILADHNSLLVSVAAGEMTPQEARLISTLLEARRRSWEASDLSDQLDRIEDRHDRNKKGRLR